MQSVICSATPQLRPVRELLSIFFKVDLAGVLGNFAQPMQYRDVQLRKCCNILVVRCDFCAIIAVSPPPPDWIRLDSITVIMHFDFFFPYPNNLTSSYSEGCKSES